MARLNESTAPVESIEILKRRFVRQNREIARVNSIQSLRIRSLESEVSHLLSENVSLREQTISLSQELERYEAAKMLHDGVYDIKAKLDSRLAELNSLVTDLGALPRRCGKLYEETTESEGPKHSSLSSFDLRRRATESEYNAVPEDGKLPVILEDKCYPRKTLNPQELSDFVQNAPGTPRSPVVEDIGLGQMEEESRHLSPELPEGLTDFQIIDSDPEEVGTSLPPTLETRRKRKPSPIATNKTECAVDPEPATTYHDLKLSSKSGAKRKFTSEDDEAFDPTPADEDDDFQYTRPSHIQHMRDQPTSIPIENSPSKKQVDKKGGSRERGTSKRKVLESKSTNSTVIAPNKLRALRDEKTISNNIRIQDENRQLSAADRKAEKDRPGKGMIERRSSCDVDQHPPEDENIKYAAEHESSRQDPTSSAPQIPKDEAPNAARPSRRQRAVVSYAEPNLRDKMRRPTNEFADAVKGGDSRRKSNTEGSHTSEGHKGGRQSSAGFDAADGVTDLPMAEEAQESFPKHSMGMVSQRKRRTLPANTDDQSSIYDYPYEATTQKQPVSPTQDHVMRSELGTDEYSGRDANTGRDRQRSALEFDAIPTKRTTKSSAKQTRRHSSNPRSSERTSRPHDGEDYLPQEYPQDDYVGSMPTATDKHVLDADPYMHLGDPQLDMEQAASKETDGKQVRRGQRAAARRKSMML